MEFELDTKKNNLDNKVSKLFNVKIDKSRKTTVTSLLTAFKMNSKEIIDLFDNSELIISSYIQDQLSGDLDLDLERQVQEIYKKIRQGETATAEGASKYLYGLLFDKRKYDLTKAGRFKLQQKLAVKNRLIGKVLAENLIDINGKVVIKKDTEITKNMYSLLEQTLDAGAMEQTVSFNNVINSKNKVQKIRVYKNNELKTEVATIIGVPTSTTDE